MIEQKRKELEARQAALDKQIGEDYERERERLLEQKKQAAKDEMLARLRKEAMLED